MKFHFHCQFLRDIRFIGNCECQVNRSCSMVVIRFRLDWLCCVEFGPMA